MFNFQCQQQGGQVIGTCIDGFLFGACCSLSPESLEAMFSETETSPNSQLKPINQLQSIDDAPEKQSLLNSVTKKNTTPTHSTPNLNINNLVITNSPMKEMLSNNMLPSNISSDFEKTSQFNHIEDTTRKRIILTTTSSSQFSTMSNYITTFENTEYTTENNTKDEIYTSTELYSPLVQTKIIDKIISNLIEDTEFSTRKNDFATEKILLPIQMNDLDSDVVPVSASSLNTNFEIKDEKKPEVTQTLSETQTEPIEIIEDSVLTTPEIITFQPINTEKTTHLIQTQITLSPEKSQTSQHIVVTSPISTKENTSNLSSGTTPQPNITTRIKTSSTITEKENEVTTFSFTTPFEDQVEGTTTTPEIIQPTTYKQTTSDSDEFTLTTLSNKENIFEDLIRRNVSNTTSQLTTTNLPEFSTSSSYIIFSTTHILNNIVTKDSNELSTPNMSDPMAIWTTKKPFARVNKTTNNQVGTTSFITKTMPIIVTSQAKPILRVTQPSSSNANVTTTDKPSINFTHNNTFKVVPFTGPTKPTTQKDLLFWTTRPPPARPHHLPTFSPISSTSTLLQNENFTSPEPEESISSNYENSSFPFPGNSQSIYENVIKKIASNLLKGESTLEESSTQPWGSSIHPIFTLSYDIVNNNKVPVLSSNTDNLDYIKVSSLVNQTLPVAESTKLPFSTTAYSETENPNATLKITSPPNSSNKQEMAINNSVSERPPFASDESVKPPLDINLLMQVY